MYLLKKIFRWYLFLPLAPIIWSSFYAYHLGSFDLNKLILLTLISIFSVSIALMMDIVHQKLEYAPIKKFLETLNIASNDESPNVLTIVIIISLLLFSMFILSIFLSSMTDGVFFTVGVISLLIMMFSLAGPFPFYYKGLNQIIVFTILGIVFTNITFYVYTFTINTVSILSSITIGSLVTGAVALRDYRNIYTDKGKKKQTISNLAGFKKARLSLIFIYSLTYIPSIVMIFFVHSVWTLIPLFSLPLSINIILKAYSRWGTDLTPNLFMSVIFIFYHLSLMLLGVYMIVHYL